MSKENPDIVEEKLNRMRKWLVDNEELISKEASKNDGNTHGEEVNTTDNLRRYKSIMDDCNTMLDYRDKTDESYESEIELDVSKLQYMTGFVMYEIIRNFIGGFIFGIENGYAQTDGTHALFPNKVKLLNRLLHAGWDNLSRQEQEGFFNYARQYNACIFDFMFENK